MVCYRQSKIVAVASAQNVRESCSGLCGLPVVGVPSDFESDKKGKKGFLSGSWSD